MSRGRTCRCGHLETEHAPTTERIGQFRPHTCVHGATVLEPFAHEQEDGVGSWAIGGCACWTFEHRRWWRRWLTTFREVVE